MQACESCTNSGFLLMGPNGGPSGWSLIERCDECNQYESDWEAASACFEVCRMSQDREGITVSVSVRSCVLPIQILRTAYDKYLQADVVMNRYVCSCGDYYETEKAAKACPDCDWYPLHPRLSDISAHLKGLGKLWYATPRN
jgi:hypothetical protein